MSTISTEYQPRMDYPPTLQEAEPDYINVNYRVTSWLFTLDHKRIAILYLVTITVMFLLGGFFALLVRLELMTPGGDLIQADTYNKMFTMHGIIMIFFFLIPSVPAVMGNFVLPMMLGARRSMTCETPRPPKLSLYSLQPTTPESVVILRKSNARPPPSAWFPNR